MGTIGQSKLLGSTSNRTIALAFSGGADSTTLAYWVLEQYAKLGREKITLDLLVADYGQKAFNRSVQIAEVHSKILAARFRGVGYQIIWTPIKIELPVWSKDHPLSKDCCKPATPSGDFHDYEKDSIVNSHSLIDGLCMFAFTNMLSYCAMKKIKTLYAGFQYEAEEWDHLESYKHRTEDFSCFSADRLNIMQDQGFRQITRVECPWNTLRLNKFEICMLAYHFGIRIDRDTFSCPNSVPKCEICDSCKTMDMIIPDLKDRGFWVP